MFDNGLPMSILMSIVIGLPVLGMLFIRPIIARGKKPKAVREGRGGIAVVTGHETYKDSYGDIRHRMMYVCALDNGEVFKLTHPYGTRSPDPVGKVNRIVKISNKPANEISGLEYAMGNGISFEEILPGSYEHTPNWQAIQRFMKQNHDAVAQQGSATQNNHVPQDYQQPQYGYTQHGAEYGNSSHTPPYTQPYQGGQSSQNPYSGGF